MPYRVATRGPCEAAVPFDVVMFADGVTADDRVDAAALRRYRDVVLPVVHLPHRAQATRCATTSTAAAGSCSRRARPRTCRTSEREAC